MGHNCTTVNEILYLWYIQGVIITNIRVYSKRVFERTNTIDTCIDSQHEWNFYTEEQTLFGGGGAEKK